MRAWSGLLRLSSREIAGYLVSDLRGCDLSQSALPLTFFVLNEANSGHRSLKMGKRYNHIQESDLAQSGKKFGTHLHENRSGTLDGQAASR